MQDSNRTEIDSSGPAPGRFTLVIPTYNRPGELHRLLSYLACMKVACRVLVLDSSDAGTQEGNRAFATGLSLGIDFRCFDPQLPPWEKFRQGSDLVDTEYCAFCADDDLIIPGAITRLTDYLEAHPDHVLAHGWYFAFQLGAEMSIVKTVYRSESIDVDDPLRRLLGLFSNYEALTYGVYRTNILRGILSDVGRVESMLAKELLGGALTVVRGKVARLPLFYSGRSFVPSHPYLHWHPLDFFASSPDKLYRDYSTYRACLTNEFSSLGYRRMSVDELTKAIDIVHFRYLADYVKPHVMEYMAEQLIRGAPKDEIMRGIWARLASEGERPLVARLAGNRQLRWIRDRYFPRFRLHHIKWYADRAGHKILLSTTAGGHTREYIFYKEFLDSLVGSPISEKEIGAMISALDCYE